MRSFCVIAVTLLQLLAVGIATADERLSGNWEVTVWQLSKHLESSPEGRFFNEVNPGVGIRKYFATTKSGVEVFADANYISKNSTGGKTILAGVGGQHPVLSKGHTDLLIGGVAGVMQYENSWEQKKYVSPGAYPFVGLRYKDVTVTMGYIPHVSIKNKSTYEALFVYASVKF